ncbi:uncharacterized protein LOC117647185 [Thrips palmi]|uniref:Uncharacterized protein LOC117647185 n=1 Tax=Thrips palmi TaxID=161013 RepID=A0A6P8Z3R0_THRPL|nr:uncharacterized protein LOC117647185 [Thrips palmi]
MDLSLLDLPDDALLAVLAYLSRAELLGCRVVCRRLRDLCLHRHLWKSAAIDTVKRLPGAPCPPLPPETLFREPGTVADGGAKKEGAVVGGQHRVRRR